MYIVFFIFCKNIYYCPMEKNFPMVETRKPSLNPDIVSIPKNIIKIPISLYIKFVPPDDPSLYSVHGFSPNVLTTQYDFHVSRNPKHSIMKPVITFLIFDILIIVF